MAITRAQAIDLGLDLLYHEVKKLESLTEHERIIKKLQEISAILLTAYELQVGAKVVDLLVIEAYYHNPSQNFEDYTVHNKPQQINHFGELYFHTEQPTICQKSGVDLCLSLGTYSLSFLLKNTVVDGQFTLQTHLHSMIANDYSESTPIVLKKRTSPVKDHIVFLPRKFPKSQLSNNQPDALLASLPLNKTEGYNLTLADGHGKMWRCSLHALEQLSNLGEARNLASTLNKAKIEDLYWDNAILSWKYHL